MTPKGCHLSQVNGVADRETGQSMIDRAKDLGQIGGVEEFAWRAIAWLLQQLREEFPEYLRVDCPQDTQASATGEQVQKSKRADDFKLPWREEEGTAGMPDFQRLFFSKACLVKGTFGTLQFVPNEGLGEPGRLIGESRWGWCPTRRDGIS